MELVLVGRDMSSRLDSRYGRISRESWSYVGLRQTRPASADSLGADWLPTGRSAVVGANV